MSLQIIDRPRVLFHVQHLLGTGHLKRALTLVDAMRDLGLDVHLLSGGTGTAAALDDDHLVQLPPLRALDENFSTLVDESDRQIDIEWRENRCRLLLQHFHRLQPDIVIIESFPFGRRQLRFELIPLLDEISKATPQPLVLCSVRDIVQTRPHKRRQETVDILRRYFDLIMVHGDPALVRFEDSFQDIMQIQNQIHYTGYVSRAVDRYDADVGHNEVIVSAGGGAVGEQLLATAMTARQHSQLGNVLWRILVGPNFPRRVFDRLHAQTKAGIVIEQNREDFVSLLRNCAVSVSQAGYNTVMDVLRAGARAVLVPFEGDGETEQILRAQKLEQRGIAEVVTEKALSADELANAIDRRVLRPRPGLHLFNLDGASCAARFVLDVWQKHVTASSE